jgi:hypothetical protein
MSVPFALRRFLEARPQPPPGERCELCGQPIAEEHGHVVSVEARNLLCVCRPCYLLFTREGAAHGKYRSVPDRYRYAPGVVLTDAQWEELQIPVGIAFFFFNTPMARTVAFYPSPAGATESLLPLTTWAALVQAHPLLGSLAPDVEALLLRRLVGRFECFLVPIDACYELVGRLRRHWRGFDGGDEVRSEIEAFFEGLRARSDVVETAAG